MSQLTSQGSQPPWDKLLRSSWTHGILFMLCTWHCLHISTTCHCFDWSYPLTWGVQMLCNGSQMVDCFGMWVILICCGCLMTTTKFHWIILHPISSPLHWTWLIPFASRICNVIFIISNRCRWLHKFRPHCLHCGNANLGYC